MSSLQMQSEQDLRDVVLESLAERESDGRPCPQLIWNGDVAATYGRFRMKANSANYDELRAMVAVLNKADGSDARESQQRTRWQEDDERRELAGSEMTAEEFESVNAEAIAAARRAAEREAAPMSAAQGDVMLSLLRTIAEKLEKR